MDRNSCAKMFVVSDAMDDIKAERKRLEKIVGSKEFERNTSNWGWTIKWLQETDEQHLLEVITIKNWAKDDPEEEFDPQHDYCERACSICFKPRRYLLSTSFSFCNEYGCGMNICKNCAEKIGEIAKFMTDED